MDLPPANPEAERAILGAALISDSAARWLAANLEAKHFYQDINGQVCLAVAGLVADHEPVDIISVSTRLRSAGHLDGVGGPQYLKACQDGVANANHVEFYGREVLRHYHDREIIKLSTRLGQYTKAQDCEARDKTLEAIRELSRTRDGFGITYSVSIGSAIEQALDGFDSGPAKLIRTGISQVDKLITGLAEGDLLTIAARPGDGKTVAGMTMAVNMALDGKKVVYFGGEMKASQMILRTMASRSGVEHGKLRGRTMTPAECRAAIQSVDDIRDLDFAFFDKPSPNIRDIASFADSYRGGADVIFVDYLTRCEMPNAGDYRLGVAEFMRRLKNIGRDTGRRVVLMAQLNRLTDRTPDRRPTLSDLSESAAIEHESDAVALLYQKMEEKIKDDSLVEFIFAKSRSTARGIVEVPWHRPTMRMGDPRHPATPMMPDISMALGRQPDRAKLAANDVDDQEVPF